MGRSDGDGSPARYVPPGSCSWCGHPQHDNACSKTIRTRTYRKTGPMSAEPVDVTVPCPCLVGQWNRAQERARAAYRAEPTTPRSVTCRCGNARTTHRSGLCKDCRKAGR